MLKQIQSLLRKQKIAFLDRDLSWLQFNDRVLGEAKDPANPPLERLKFLGITSSNLDEFFMIRFSTVSQKIKKADLEKNNRQFKDLDFLREAILSFVSDFHRKQDRVNRLICQILKKENILVFDLKSQNPRLREAALAVFDREIRPQLPKPQPLSKDSIYLLENLQTFTLTGDDELLSLPKALPSFYVERLGKEIFVFFTDDLLAAFSSPKGKNLPLFRLTRDGDVTLDFDGVEGEDFSVVPEVVRSHIKKREFGRPVRLQVRGNTRKPLGKWVDHLGLDKSQIFYGSTSFYIASSFRLVSQIQDQAPSKPHLFFRPFKSFTPPTLRKAGGILDKIREHDYLIHHPYDSFDSYVNFLEEAVNDPRVFRIQQTVYRVDTLSPVTGLLKTAAQKSKQVRVLIEPRARFDEINNIELAQDLRSAGVKVVFATGALKLHAKVALVERKVGSNIEFFTHLSTGNYNAKTARLYTDLAILTARKDLGEDAKNFFDSVCAKRMPKGFKYLVLAPSQLHKRLMSLIDIEIEAAKRGHYARIFIKANALVDQTIVTKLYEASQKGVSIDLVIRGACSLVPKIKGLSENIRVISVVDKFLEHSRMYFFHNSNEIYLSSADAMPRNFFSRLEIAFPVLDHNIFAFLRDHFSRVYLNDRVKARELNNRGVWSKRRKTRGVQSVRAQKMFEAYASDSYKFTPLHKREPYRSV